jgi:hypothetical protein
MARMLRWIPYAKKKSHRMRICDNEGIEAERVRTQGKANTVASHPFVFKNVYKQGSNSYKHFSNN